MRDGTRRFGATALACFAAFMLLLATLGFYAQQALFDSDGFADRATAALDDEAVRAEIATRVADDVVINADANLIAVRPVIQSVVDGIVGGSVFQSVFRNGVRDVHRAVFKGDENTVTLTLADIGEVLRGALQALRPQISKQIPGGIDIELTRIEPPPWLVEVARVADHIVVVEAILLLLALASIAAALWMAVDRRRTVITIGVAIIVLGVAAAVALSAIRGTVLAQVDEASVRDAVAGVWRAFLGDLSKLLYLFAACGAVIAAASSSLLRPVEIGAPLRWTAQQIARVPERPLPRALRAIGLIVVGVLVVASRDTVVDLLVILAGLYLVYAGVSELLRMTVARQEDEVRADRIEGRRALATAAVAAVVIVVAGSVFVGAGGARETPLKIKTVGCNGSEALCDETLDQVAIAATHNAMSAATHKDWLFAQQEAGFPEQLRDGIRGLLIDAHYGTPTASGRVKTDLSDLEGSERDTYTEELGPEALDAALRIRDRVVDSPPTGPRQVYLCHRFCELGAIPIVKAFKQYRDFLAANPDEVLVIVIEDYVKPSDIDEAVRESGLIDYVYKGALDPEDLPTLQEIIDSGGRALLMAENEDGGAAIPYYGSVYDQLVQETPFSFGRPDELTDPAKLNASCKPNRGHRSAPIFLLNHWVDTSPAPKPSNATQVNSHDALMARIRRCERDRGQPVNLVAVDFYREGDLFGVVDELNREREADAQPSGG